MLLKRGVCIYIDLVGSDLVFHVVFFFFFFFFFFFRNSEPGLPGYGRGNSEMSWRAIVNGEYLMGGLETDSRMRRVC